MLLRCLEIASKHGYIVSKQLLSTFVPLPRPLLLHKMPNSWRRPAEPTMYMKLNHHPYCTRLSFIKKPSCAPLSHIGIVVRLHHALILLYYNYKPCMAMMSQQQTHVNVVPSSTSLLLPTGSNNFVPPPEGGPQNLQRASYWIIILVCALQYYLGHLCTFMNAQSLYATIVFFLKIPRSLSRCTCDHLCYVR